MSIQQNDESYKDCNSILCHTIVSSSQGFHPTKVGMHNYYRTASVYLLQCMVALNILFARQQLNLRILTKLHVMGFNLHGGCLYACMLVPNTRFGRSLQVCKHRNSNSGSRNSKKGFNSIGCRSHMQGCGGTVPAAEDVSTFESMQSHRQQKGWGYGAVAPPDFKSIP